MPSSVAVAIMDGSHALMTRDHDDGLRYPVLLQPAAEAAARLGLAMEDSIFLGLDDDGGPVFALPISKSNEKGLRNSESHDLFAAVSSSVSHSRMRSNCLRDM